MLLTMRFHFELHICGSVFKSSVIHELYDLVGNRREPWKIFKVVQSDVSVLQFSKTGGAKSVKKSFMLEDILQIQEEKRHGHTIAQLAKKHHVGERVMSKIIKWEQK